MSQDPATSAPTLLAQAGEYQRAGRLAEAAAAYRAALRLAPRDAAAWMALGGLLVRAGAFADAAQAFERVVALRPDAPAGHVNLGNALRRLGRLADAADSYRRGIALDPELPQAHFNLGNVLADAGETDAAVAAYEAALARDPGYLAAATNLGNLLLRQGRADEALRHFEVVLDADPASPRVHYNIGIALQGLGRDTDAAAAFVRALADDDRDLESWNNLCISLLRAGRPAEALVACDAYLARSPANRKPLAYRAAALIELGRRDEARVLLDFERLLLHHPVPPPPGHASIAMFNAALCAHVRRHPTLAWEPPDKSTFGGSQTGELLAGEQGPAVAFKGIIADAVAAHMRRVRHLLPEHPWVLGLPQRWRVATWAVVLQDQGHQGPHFHPDGYISGVYYASLPPTMAADDAGHAGWIEFGRTADAIGGTREPMLELVRPEEGLMLLFPSYLYHRTIPFRGDAPRISIAFDVMPAD